MMHVRSSSLVAWSGGALPEARRRRIAAHLLRCAHCRGRLARIGEIRMAVRQLASPTAPDVWAAISERVRAGETVVLPAPPVVAVRQGRRRIGMAALVLLMVAAALSGTLLVEPLRSRLGGAMRAPDAPRSGVELVVAAAGLDLVLVDAGPQLRLHVTAGRTSDTARISGVGEAAGARFSMGERRLTIRGAHAGELRIELPATARAVRLSAGSFIFARVRDGHIYLDGEQPMEILDEPLARLVPARLLAPRTP